MVLSLFAGCVLVLFCLVLIVDTPSFFGLKVFEPKTGPGGGGSESNDEILIEESVENCTVGDDGVSDVEDVNVTSIDEAVVELESLGCTVTVVESIEGSSSSSEMRLSFQEFKKMAVKQEVVFRYTYSSNSILFIPYENTFLFWLPDDQVEEQYTGFEKVEIQTGYATAASGSTGLIGWKVTLSVKNSGSKTANLTHVFINDMPITLSVAGNDGLAGEVPTPSNPVARGSVGSSISRSGFTLQPKKSGTIYLWISSTYKKLSSGTTINIKLHSSGGMDYIKLIRLP